MFFYDTHIHSQFSPDSRLTIDEAVNIAKQQNLHYSQSLNRPNSLPDLCNLSHGQKGNDSQSGRYAIRGVSFTDHLDLDAPRNNGRFLFDIKEQQKGILKLENEINDSTISLLKGIEVGLQPHSIQHSKEYISQHNFDIIIASLHFIDGKDPYIGGYFDDKNYHQAFSRALELIYQTCSQFENFDVVGHFDYVARYSPYDVYNITYSQFGDYLDPILKYLAQNGKALEVNTKTYSLHPNGHIQELDTAILKRFKEIGGELITLGSDAHSYSRIGDKFDYFWDIIHSCGFNYLTYFKNRKPILYNPEKSE